MTEVVIYMDASGSAVVPGARDALTEKLAEILDRHPNAKVFAATSGDAPNNIARVRKPVLVEWPNAVRNGGSPMRAIKEHIIDNPTPDMRVFITDTAGDLTLHEKSWLSRRDVAIFEVAPKERSVLLRCGYVHPKDRRYKYARDAKVLDDQIIAYTREFDDLCEAFDRGGSRITFNAGSIDIWKKVQNDNIKLHPQVMDAFPWLLNQHTDLLHKIATKGFGMAEQAAHIAVGQINPALLGPANIGDYVKFTDEFVRTPDNPYALISTRPQEDTNMAGTINTTVSLNIAHQDRATIGEVKALIAEVERVGGTDDSIVTLNSMSRSCIDAVVVTAKTTDSAVDCALSIEDDEQRLSTLLDIATNGTREQRVEARKHLSAAKPAKKK